MPSIALSTDRMFRTLLVRAALSSTLAPAALAALLAAGCASAPSGSLDARTAAVPAAQTESPVTLGLADAIAELAIGMVGARYAEGGADPSQGFDCSGLAYYAYTQAGYRIPRSSQEQFRAARKIALREAGKGDLVFFQDEAKLSHVGIYLGDGRFVHAPASTRRVTVSDLSSPYYQEHLVGVGRLLPPGL